MKRNRSYQRQALSLPFEGGAHDGAAAPGRRRQRAVGQILKKWYSWCQKCSNAPIETMVDGLVISPIPPATLCLEWGVRLVLEHFLDMTGPFSDNVRAHDMTKSYFDGAAWSRPSCSRYPKTSSAARGSSPAR